MSLSTLENDKGLAPSRFMENPLSYLCFSFQSSHLVESGKSDILLFGTILPHTGDLRSALNPGVPQPSLAGRRYLSLQRAVATQTNTSLFCALCPHSCAPGKDFPVGHPSSNCSGPSTLNLGVLFR